MLEGNRHVATLKILSSTSLASSLGLTTGLLKKYMSLIDRAKNSLPSEIQCTVLPREDAKYWIMLKHTGENEGNWHRHMGWSGTPSISRFFIGPPGH